MSRPQHFPRKRTPWFSAKSFPELKLPLLYGCCLSQSLGVASAWRYGRAGVGLTSPVFGDLKVRAWSMGESQRRKTKTPEGSSSHFKTAGLNCHLELPEHKGSLGNSFWTGLWFSGSWHYERWKPAPRADKQKKTEWKLPCLPVAKSLRAQHWNLEHSVPFPKYKKSLSPLQGIKHWTCHEKEN